MEIFSSTVVRQFVAIEILYNESLGRDLFICTKNIHKIFFVQIHFLYIEIRKYMGVERSGLSVWFAISRFCGEFVISGYVISDSLYRVSTVLRTHQFQHYIIFCLPHDNVVNSRCHRSTNDFY